MKLIVGLGNPGTLYADSRHNAGYAVVKAIAHSQKASLKRDNGTSSLSARIKAGPKTVILALPLTFMNLSGIAVKALSEKHKIDLADLLIVYDDMDLKFGRMKLRPFGSSAGHKGVESVINSLASDRFARLKIGIGRPHRNGEPSDYVLTVFSKKEKEEIPGIIKAASDCCLSWVQKGIAETMNVYNKKE
ncbi:MAG: aminoacyl-tRNA hydrolase [Candidatus Omnitrophota bacterium]|jgi:PTH1 family peptidyl-tRNA hydrolase